VSGPRVPTATVTASGAISDGVFQRLRQSVKQSSPFRPGFEVIATAMNPLVRLIPAEDTGPLRMQHNASRAPRI